MSSPPSPRFGFWVEGSGLRARLTCLVTLGCGVEVVAIGLGFRVEGLGWRVWGLGFRVEGLGS